MKPQQLGLHERQRLGRSGLIVSRVGLGTMNFGSQLEEREAHRIADVAFDLGITLFDTAEMYPSPPSADTYGISERIVGQWLSTKPRDSVVVATKIVGPPDGLYDSGAHVRSRQASLDRFHIRRAIDDSLARLKTDYIDLFQFHWPDRIVPWEEQLEAVGRAVDQGKIRYFGCSNETAWGLMRAVGTGEKLGLPRPVSVQNVLNLLEFEDYRRLEEVCSEEGIGYIAYSPLAMGLLSGKYQGTDLPEGSRFARWSRYRDRYLNGTNLSALDALDAAAQRHGVSLPELAYWWCLTRPAVSVVLTSASKPEQLALVSRALQLADTAAPDLQGAGPGVW